MGLLASRLDALQAPSVATNCDEGYVLTGNPFPPSRAIPDTATASFSQSVF